MEYVGRRVKKEFLGHGTFFGSVRAYDPSTGFFRISYDDGDSEEVESSEIASLLVSPESLPLQESCARKPGRPRKRRRIFGKGKIDDFSVINGDIFDNYVGRGGGDSRDLDLNLNEGVDLNDNGFNCLLENDHDGNEVGGGAKLHGLDLNQGLNVRLDLNEGAMERSLGEKKEMIDLNLDVSEDFENMHGGRNPMCFDLNLKLLEDEASNLDGCVGQLGTHETVCVEGDTDTKKEVVVDANMEVLNECGDVGNGNLDKDDKEILVKSCENGLDCENTAQLNTVRKRRGRKRKDSFDYKIGSSTSETIKLDSGTGNLESELTSREETPLKSGSDSVDYENGNSSSVLRGRRGRKRKELSDNNNNNNNNNNNSTLPTPDTKLRRSSRRANMATISGQDHASNVAGMDGINYQSSSPAISTVYDEKIVVPNPRKSWDHILPPKVELPPSSCNLDLDEVSIFDFLSVYAFLRSFSTLLFLSPFEADDFVASIKCNDSTILFDSVHVSLLRAIRKHLESLVSEGSVSASNCLRSLNWDYLDLITWPMFVVEYLLLHSPGYIPGLDLCHLKSFQNDYYKLPVSAKVEILRHLCDDVIEVDAFRSELNRRTSAAEGQVELGRSIKFDSSKRRKAAMDVVSTSCITEEEVDDHTDWNSDECFLCKMDGNLICCDGCPAAFHSRCVGVASKLLPEGDWYCPECTIDKGKPWMKVGKSIRGAKLLGVDPYGRLYYSSCGYLLVLELCNDQHSFWLYNRNGLLPLIEALDSLPILYNPIISSICKQWNIIHEVGGTRNDLDAWSYSVQSGFPQRRQPTDICQTPSETLNEVVAEKKSIGKSTVPNYSGNPELDTAQHVNVMLNTDNHGVKLESRLASSEGSAEVSQAFIKEDMLREDGLDCSKRCADISDVSQIPGKLVSSAIAPPAKNCREIRSQVHYVTDYVNCYEFARTASSVFEDVICKMSSKSSDNATRSVEDVIAAQLRVVSNRSTDFSWTNIHNSYANSRKENCGWCIYCKGPEEVRDCLFFKNDCIPAVENFTSEVLGIQFGYNRKKHLIGIMCHIICMEDRLHGLLLGPWLNPHYSALWRECVLELTNFGSMKKLLLKLEANLHRLALSADWRKTVDSVRTMGSAAYIVSSSVQVSSKHGIGRKRAKGPGLQRTPSSNSMTGLTLLWWRGGRGSRDLFNWKVLPHSLASKAGRQGGLKKITGILYPDSGEYAKRTKCDAWRAAVETSKSVEQLALQVRELDANIRWDEIGNSNLLSKMDNESKKSVRLFKKVIIRRKSSEGTMVKYLLDFGRRRFIPDVVVKHGSMLEDSTSQKKKYWLEESHIPLHLLKAFEEKRIARRLNKMSFGKHHENSRIMRNPFKKKGFPYLFSRAERLENYQCGHCNKDVLIREAVSCQHCKGFFHKRHILKSGGFAIAVPTYTCHKCRDRKLLTTDARNSSKANGASKRLKSGKGKRHGKEMLPVKSKNKKIAPLVITLRRSARNAERMSKLSLHNNKVKKRKKKRQTKSQKGKLMKLKNSCWHKKRSPVNSSYWLNGLLLSRKPNDERLVHFRNKMLLVVSEEATSYIGKPKCCLCNEMEHTSNVTYVACEICGVWFHGDALGLSAEKFVNLIGYRCYKCLNKKPPVCPYDCPTVNKKAELMPKNNADFTCIGMDSNGLLRPGDRSTDPKSQSKEENGYISFTVNIDKKSSGSILESDQKNNGLQLNEKILVRNGSVELGERKDVFDAAETETAIFSYDVVD